MFVNASELGFGGSMLRTDEVPIDPHFLPPNGQIAGRILRVLNDKKLGKQFAKMLQRNDNGASIETILQSLGQYQFERAVTSSLSAFPVRENLEAVAKLTFPLDTPVRNMLPRIVGQGLSSRWKQFLSFGGGYGASTTMSGSSTAGSNTNLPVASSAGFIVGDSVLVGTGANLETCIVTVVPDTTHVTVASTANNHVSTNPVVRTSVQPGGGTAIQSFFGESGSPAERTTSYAEISATYKLMGVRGSVTGLAMAGGANFQNQLLTEKQNLVKDLLLTEEFMLINGDSTRIDPPFGDGTTAYAFNGLTKLITTANGTPSSQVQTAVGALTTKLIDQMLQQLFYQGAQGLYMIMNPQELLSLTRILLGYGASPVPTWVRTMAGTNGVFTGGGALNGYMNPISGQIVPIMPSRFLSPGTIIFGATSLPDGSPAADVSVLPQVQLPALAPNQNVQGYTAQDIAPQSASPQNYPFMVSVYEVLRLKSALHFGIATGVTQAG